MRARVGRARLQRSELGTSRDGQQRSAKLTIRPSFSAVISRITVHTTSNAFGANDTLVF